MKKKFWLYWALALVLVAAVGYYPIVMGVRVVGDMIRQGTVMEADFPKYVIPYTPVTIAVIFGTLLMPLLLKLKKWGLPVASVLCLGVFFAAERWFEVGVTVTTTTLVPLESWQMALCFVPPERYETRVWEAVDVLLGGYSPWFKLHFYAISVVLILSLLGSLYGFGRMILTGDSKGKRTLILQTVAAVGFLGLCIWACFTSFYRGGELNISPLSAALMSLFFIVFGVTAGLFAGGFTVGKGKGLAVVLPAFVAVAVTILMYVGEMILLSGNLYRFGQGFFFEALGMLVFAPVDIAVILLSGIITTLLLRKN